MTPPKTPPNWQQAFLALSNEEQIRLVQADTLVSAYPHWNKLIYLTPPNDLNHTQWWSALKLRRAAASRQIPLRDKSDNPFQFLVPDAIQEMLHQIDRSISGQSGIPKQIITPEFRQQYHVSAFIEEAITSSQLEGATTTRQVAKEMIMKERPPQDRSEQMILNNYRTMQRIIEVKEQPLTPQLILELHRLVCHEAMDNPEAIGRFRKADERVVVGDNYGEVYHEPPAAGELEERIAAMCDFANGKTPGGFVHPALRAMILHFWMAYDHPFVDGNGRTARALFYWAMLHHGYWLCEFISISHVIKNAPAQYSRAFLYTETDDNDLTYFILYHVEILKKALVALDEYVARKTNELRTLEHQFQTTVLLNSRQQSLISHALRHPSFLYTTYGHQNSHGVSYQTARNDLTDLRDKGLLGTRTSGKTTYFRPVEDLKEKLEELD